jgi:hypothetical protein
LPRSGSRVRIPSPAPIFFRLINESEGSVGVFFCFPASGREAGEARGKQACSGLSAGLRTSTGSKQSGYCSGVSFLAMSEGYPKSGVLHQSLTSPLLALLVAGAAAFRWPRCPRADGYGTDRPRLISRRRHWRTVMIGPIPRYRRRVSPFFDSPLDGEGRSLGTELRRLSPRL